MRPAAPEKIRPERSLAMPEIRCCYDYRVRSLAFTCRYENREGLFQNLGRYFWSSTHLAAASHRWPPKAPTVLIVARQIDFVQCCRTIPPRRAKGSNCASCGRRSRAGRFEAILRGQGRRPALSTPAYPVYRAQVDGQNCPDA